MDLTKRAAGDPLAAAFALRPEMHEIAHGKAARTPINLQFMIFMEFRTISYDFR